jgi:hypothetical protein
MERINYVIATWGGSRMRAKDDLLQVQLKRLFELKNSLSQITLVKPTIDGNNNEDYYDLPKEIMDKVVILERPQNDNAYGQFFYAYETYRDKFDYYIICLDDYIPNIDNFDTILLELLKKRNADYVCGTYGYEKPPHHMEVYMANPLGIIKTSAFEKAYNLIQDKNNHFKNIPAGQEIHVFSDLFRDSGAKIKGYNDEYPVVGVHGHHFLVWYQKKKSFNTIFVPYEHIVGKKFDKKDVVWEQGCI